jgi:uncharacterized protein involved in exopolysaccharide biosynthesis
MPSIEQKLIEITQLMDAMQTAHEQPRDLLEESIRLAKSEIQTLKAQVQVLQEEVAVLKAGHAPD